VGTKEAGAAGDKDSHDRDITTLAAVELERYE